MSSAFFAGSYGGDDNKLRDESRLECKICWYVYDPAEGDDYWQIPPGTPFSQLPAGPYEFILGEEAGIGRYQMCSLFSPVFEFADQATAVATAEAVMHALMSEENRDTLSTREGEISRRWLREPGEESTNRQDRLGCDDQVPGLRQRLQQPLSRRDLLRGQFQRDADQ
ncbi:MAG: [NiFe]-hydrogenase assembly chaperone HybE [Candidatus Thiodiazotropha sp. (ex Dulcina madagascariensis)]|nr:[NiFe]-hydrogenase assembly chaperone HybE [Candidatus Thiodiazotropha sp. (ex Dulcina madagascariensis)]